MKVHKYQQTVYESILDFTHGSRVTQTVIYIPNQGVIGFRDNENTDFFSDDPAFIQKVDDFVNGRTIRGNRDTSLDDCKYLGEIELPDDVVNKVILTGRVFSESKKEFNDSSRKLVEML